MYKIIASLLCGIMLVFSSSLTASAALDSPSQTYGWFEQLRFHPDTGILKDNGRGYIYLKVDDEYIREFFPLLDAPGYSIPPYFRRGNSPGAHISVFYEEETRTLPPIKEVGDKFNFTIMSIKTVNAGRKKYIILTVRSPELEALRTKYGLRPLLQGHEFHISIAVKDN